jgi:hypothetical protein
VAADSRRASLNLWITQWFDTSGTTCDGDICQTTNTATIPRIQINGDHFNLGDVFVGLYRTSDDTVLWSIEGTARAQSGYSGGAFGARTPRIDCGLGRDNAYAQAYDHTSERWSDRVYVDVECAVSRSLPVGPGRTRHAGRTRPDRTGVDQGQVPPAPPVLRSGVAGSCPTWSRRSR